MRYISGKVGVIVGVGTAQIIFLTVAVGYKVLEVAHDSIVRASAVREFTHIIIGFFAAVQAQDSTDAFFVKEILYFLGQQYTVGG